MNQLEACQVDINARLVDAMHSLERSSAEIVLAMNAGILAGTLTDGDIRRALLKGATLESPVAPFVQRKFTAVGSEVGRAEVLDLMQARMIDQIPVTDGAGRLLGLHLLHKLIGRKERTNAAVIMAGGLGVRLRPITEHVPKPMIRVAGRPILERLLLHLVGHGIRTIHLSVRHLGHIIEEYFEDGSRFGCSIQYLRETQPLGTGGALSLLETPPTEPLLVLNGDLVSQFNTSALLDFHAMNRYSATIGVHHYAHTVPFGCVETEGTRITKFEEKPVVSRQVNAGIYVLEPALLARVPAAKAFPITALFDECLVRGEPIGAFEIQEDWIDVGQRDQLQAARGESLP